MVKPLQTSPKERLAMHNPCFQEVLILIRLSEIDKKKIEANGVVIKPISKV